LIPGKETFKTRVVEFMSVVKMYSLMFEISLPTFLAESKRGNLRYYFSCDGNGINVFNAAVPS
jgi:hypothetical protein